LGRWDARKAGAAAIECAFVAAGILKAVRFETPNIWDVAAGLALLSLARAWYSRGRARAGPLRRVRRAR